MKWTENITDDGGLTYHTESEDVIFGTYFFLDEKMMDFQLQRYNLFSFLSEIGGLLSTVTLSVGSIMILYTGRATDASVMQNMYFSPQVDMNDFKISEKTSPIRANQETPFHLDF